MVVTCGALAAIAMTARALTTTGDRVLVESPTYPNALATWRRSGARLTGVGVDPQGWDLDSVVAGLRQVARRAAYVVPDFHNPTGSLMDDEQRARLGHALVAARTTAVVDETLVEVSVDRSTSPRRWPPTLPAQ